MNDGKILMNAALLTVLVVGMGVFAKPAATQEAVACPPGYYYLPGAGCQVVRASQLNYSQLNYWYGYPLPYAYAPYAYPYYYYYWPYAVNGGVGLRGRR